MVRCVRSAFFSVSWVTRISLTFGSAAGLGEGRAPAASGRLDSSIPSAILEQEAQMFELRDRVLASVEKRSPQQIQVREVMIRQPLFPFSDRQVRNLLNRLKPRFSATALMC